MSKSLNCSNFDRYVELYNTQGRDAALSYVSEECKMDYAVFQRKMRNESQYIFNRSTRMFEEHGEETHFMSLEELCSIKTAVVQPVPTPISVAGKTSFDEIVIDLMRDRITEMSKYIKFDQSAKQVIVDVKGLKESGYRLSVV
jgi:hypothetical protein